MTPTGQRNYKHVHKGMVGFYEIYKVNQFDGLDDFCGFDIKNAKCIKTIKQEK